MSSEVKNKIKYGLKNAHYALVTEGVTGEITFSTPKKLPGAVNLTASALGDKTAFYADDEEYFGEFTNNGYEGSLELSIVPDEFKVDVLGETLDTKNVQFEKTNAVPKKFALLFEFTGDRRGIKHLLYYCTAKRPNIEGETKGETKEPKTETFDFTSTNIPGTTIVKAKTTDTTDTTVLSSWYVTVYQETTTP